MANMYNWWPNFKTLEELKNYVDWVAKENNIDHETALMAIIDAWQITFQWKNINKWNPEGVEADRVLNELIPERKPVEWEAWYQAPKSFWETMWDEIVEWIKDDIIGYPKRTLWKLATWWYFDWKNVNTKKILDEAWVWKKWDKKTDKETTNSDKKEWKNKSGWLLKFGSDATSIEQIETRDRELAKILNERWITDISKVEEFLNHFDTFKEASPENRQRTISRIFWNIKDLNKPSKEEEKPQWIYIDQEDYKWTPEAKEGLDMYNKYAQVEAEKWDSTKVFKQMMWEAPTSNNTTAVRNKLKDAWLSTAQINDFTQAWADAYYKVDNDSPINDVKNIRRPSTVSLKKSQKTLKSK
jgi:hypothetical protein